MTDLDAIVLKAAGPILAAIGSIILAIRIEAIIDAVLLGMKANMTALLRALGKEASRELEASQARVIRELDRGKKILWWGFTLLAMGGMVNALSYFIN